MLYSFDSLLRTGAFNMLITKLVLIFCCLSVATSGRVPFFRRDYTYVDQFNAFYKLHLDSAGYSWSSAFETCEKEGSLLFYPKTKDEWKVVKTLLDTRKFKANVTAILVGIHDESGIGEFMTIEGLPTPLPLLDEYLPSSDGGDFCVMMDVETGNYYVENCRTDSVRSILCKRVELPSCPTIDHDYTFHKENNKCYKVNPRPMTWIDAKQTCFMEGGNLAVISTATEANIIRSKIGNSDYFVGFHKISPGGKFYTIKGQQIDNEFYPVTWASGADKKDCGAVCLSRATLYIKNRECQQPTPFICEMSAV